MASIDEIEKRAEELRVAPLEGQSPDATRETGGIKPSPTRQTIGVPPELREGPQDGRGSGFFPGTTQPPTPPTEEVETTAPTFTEEQQALFDDLNTRFPGGLGNINLGATGIPSGFQLPQDVLDRIKDAQTGTSGEQGPTIEEEIDKLRDPETADEERQVVRDRLIQSFNDPTKTIQDLDVQQSFTPLEQAQDELTDPTQFQIEAQGPIAAAAASATLATVTSAEAAADVQVQNYEAEVIDLATLKKSVTELAKLEPMQAASVSKNLNGLLEGMEEGNIPLWARPAVTKVEQALAARGISASSIGRDSLFNAIIGAALPIAQGDAQLEQDANKTNYSAKVQAVLSDVSQEFAAKQFNASSINQKNQFMTQMRVQVDMQNASRKDAISQFNAESANRASLANAQNETQVSVANAQMATEVTKFQANLDQQRAQFNSQQAAAIEQSNVQWRRQINQVNTAGINAVNQANVQNAFNLSNQSQTALWQEMRDEAHWTQTATEREKDRQHELETTILANEAIAAQGEKGGFGAQLLQAVTTSVVKKASTWVDGLDFGG